MEAKRNQELGMKQRFVIFMLFSAFGLAQQDGRSKPDPQAEHIHRVEQDVAVIALGKGEKPKHYDLPGLMRLYNVPGVSIAVFDDFTILWAKGYGVTESGGTNRVTTHTLFQAGDISKSVAAAGTLALIEQGKLSLDKNVNDELVSWKLPDNEFTKTEKVTLRRILSDTAGLTVHHFLGYAPAATDAHIPAEPIPTIQQILDGVKPAKNAPVRVDMVPDGTSFHYSDSSPTIEQLVVTDTVGQPFPQVMHDLVLSKVRLDESTFEHPLPPAQMALAAVGTRSDGKSVTGKYHVYPEMAAHGLWTTSTDLALFAIEIAKSAHGCSNKVLSQKMTQLMLTPQTNDGGQGVGLGFFFQDKNEFGHDGANEGFQAMLWAYSDTGSGIAIMANSDYGIECAKFLAKAISREYGWKFPISNPSAPPILRAIITAKGIDAALDWFIDLKNSNSNQINYGEYVLNGFGYEFMSNKDLPTAIKFFKLNTELYPQASNTYDSLAEAYMNAGENDLAIVNYKKSVELNPKNDNAIHALKRLLSQ
jgi:CubicO group peptidase (beta-lactamase class C family)